MYISWKHNSQVTQADGVAYGASPEEHQQLKDLEIKSHSWLGPGSINIHWKRKWSRRAPSVQHCPVFRVDHGTIYMYLHPFLLHADPVQNLNLCYSHCWQTDRQIFGKYSHPLIQKYIALLRIYFSIQGHVSQKQSYLHSWNYATEWFQLCKLLTRVFGKRTPVQELWYSSGFTLHFVTDTTDHVTYNCDFQSEFESNSSWQISDNLLQSLWYIFLEYFSTI